MKKLIAIVGLVFLGLTSSAQSVAGEIMFNGKLISTPTTQADCGSVSEAGVYEFEVIMISDNSYTATNIPVIVKCPASYGVGFFKVGANYKMELFDNNGGTSYTITNQPVLDAYNLPSNFWAGEIVIR